jgi:multidrug efflux pump
MSAFFIRRPIFAWVIAIIIMLVGLLALTRLPVSQYPNIAPPAVAINASYPGAAAKAVENSVTQVIEQNMTGLDGLIYMTSTSDQKGNVSVILTFASGTNPDAAQIQVQNKLQQATPLLPQIVQQQGITVNKTNNGYLMVVGVMSEDGKMSTGDIGDYLSSNMVDPLNRVAGVGSAEVFGSKYAMRIWLDANKLNTYNLSPTDVSNAIKEQNSQSSIGEFGDIPAVPGQQLNATITALGRLHTPEQFREIIIGSNSAGASLRLKDVARVELGQANYAVAVRFNGKPASGIGVVLAPGANALATAHGVRQLLERMQPRLPPGLKAVVPFDSTTYVKKSIEEVIKTLLEAIVLVFLVMYLFLQNMRATLIPTIAVPVVLLGTLAILTLAGFSVNMLTMFAMVLAIGLLVDDAIIVVENVERLMHDEGLGPVDATIRSMQQMTGALVGIASVLSAVFVPMAFLRGSIGVIYRQFSVTIVSAMGLSVLVALILTPALCATLLKPIDKNATKPTRGFFAAFNRLFARTNLRYQSMVGHMLVRPLRYLVLYLALASIMGLLFFRLPAAFLPSEDQSYLFTFVRGPVGSTQARTINTLAQVESQFLDKEKQATTSIFTIAGFSFGGGGQNSGFGFVELKPWGQRKAANMSIDAISERVNGGLSQIKDAEVFAFAPPPILELGTTAGFDFFLQDDFGQGHSALTAARNQFLELAAKSKLLVGVRPAGQEDAPQFHLDLDPQKALSLGLSMNDVNETLAIAWGGRYIDDFIDRERVKRVILQADAPFRMAPEDFGRWHVRNKEGKMVSVSSFANSHWEYGSPRLERFNGLSAMEINGEAAPGISSGAAMAEIEKLVAQLPPGFSANFAGQSYEERAAGAQTPLLYALSLIFVFLWLAALYESWSIPVSIMLAVPLGIIGAVLATTLRGFERDIYFQVAMLTTIGLTAKNAILVVEFAQANVHQGMRLIDATLHAVHDRLRPILMTSFAFGLGVLPLALASGAGGGAQRAIGTGVFGGMLAGTLLGVFFIPLLFVAVQRLFNRSQTESTV